jgi:hypothetical protein
MTAVQFQLHRSSGSRMLRMLPGQTRSRLPSALPFWKWE